MNIPKIRVNRGNIGNDIWVHLPDLSSFEKTYLSGDEAAGQTTLSVLDGSNFAANEYVIIGTPGTEQAEIGLVSGSADGTITVGATSFAHSQGTIITFIPFNQVVIEDDTDSEFGAATTNFVDLRVDSLETFFAYPTGTAADYYRARFYHEQSAANYSPYSDTVIATGFTYDSVHSIKKRALDQLGEEIGGTITDEFLNDSLWEARREVDNMFKRWSFRTSFNTDIGDIAEGAYSVSVPSTLRNPDSPQNILGLRIGSQGRNMEFIPKREFDMYYEAIPHTTVATQPAVGQTTLVLTTVRDLSSTGSVRIGDNLITYTGKTNSTGTLTGVPASGDGSIDATHAVGTDVWQNASYGEPTKYTIYEDTIFFNTPFDSTFEGNNIIADFYRTLPEYDSDADTLDEPDVDMFVSYLKYAIKDMKEKGTIDITNDSDYKKYAIRRNEVMKKEFIHQDVRFTPDIGHLVDVD